MYGPFKRWEPTNTWFDIGTPFNWVSRSYLDQHRKSTIIQSCGTSMPLFSLSHGQMVPVEGRIQLNYTRDPSGARYNAEFYVLPSLPGDMDVIYGSEFTAIYSPSALNPKALSPIGSQFEFARTGIYSLNAYKGIPV